MAEAERTNPQLWEQVKREITEGDKGGKPGQWSARKAQMAVREYKKRGGDYEDGGLAQDETSLHRWTEEEWGTRSGEKSGETGERYLPREVRMLLTEDEYARSTRKKRDGSGQFVAQPDDVRDKAATIRRDGPTLAILRARATDLGLEVHEAMGKAELHAAIEEATDADGRPRDPSRVLSRQTKAALYALARARGIEGRSRMTKAELRTALTGG
ncbi:aspartate-semialdehyde dehydrogenase [Oceanicola granulosus HTCC2516]|uniref:Aspartate-semialdehyde dehydrogenase n=1 Tax=Oceanicola granulosus (strain ATCC BAA-861 / DSM 15982 / KCTC 12143 / HTCC2516) TaxID=314256 RepID=Q2CCW0_OCEGH|nr:DUF5872 domain-containing protein [Oceanicola granulosus]EAR50513.1 aspartate-semialdehyde dehydrogenase [Oceanicola granulosus HTCC2516]